MEKRVYNFSPGPAVLPFPVLQEAQRDLLALPGTGISILEISHRSKAFDKIINEAEANLRSLLKIPNNYRVLFMQGGAILQFGMVAMNLLHGSAASRPITSSTALGAKKPRKKPRPKAQFKSPGTERPATTTECPKQNELKLDPNAAYTYICSNETIQGVQ